MDLYGASRDDLIPLILQQHGRIAEPEQHLARLQAEIATQRVTIRQLPRQLGEPLAATPPPADPPTAGRPPRPTTMPGLKSAGARPPRALRPRKRRLHGFARPRMEPPARQVHAVDTCPDGGTPRAGGTIIHPREVIEVPEAPITVTEHVYLERRCPCCQRPHRPPVDRRGVVAGQQRLGVRLVSLLATRRAVGRLPIRVIQALRAAVWGLDRSVGGIVGALGPVARRAGPLVAESLARIRGSLVVSMEESGGRADGGKGYIWTAGPLPERSVTRRRRAKEAVDAVVGEGVSGVVVGDFYAAYDHSPGVKQRGWSPLRRDIKALGTKPPTEAGVPGWAKGVRAIWARASGACPAPAYRAAQQRAYAQELLALCAPELGAGETAPQAVLCRRIEKSLSELFVFVGDPRVPPTNNAAERSLRPPVVARKISGGTRASAGTATKRTLATIFGTWRARGLNPFAECLHLLAAPCSPTSPA